MSRTEIDKALYSKPSKYRNKPVVIDGQWFPSGREGNRWCELRLHQRAGYIVGEIKRQVPFVLELNGVKLGTYVADFVYETQEGKTIVEDAKGMRSGVPYQLFKLKAQLVLAIHKIRVVEV